MTKTAHAVIGLAGFAAVAFYGCAKLKDGPTSSQGDGAPRTTNVAVAATPAPRATQLSTQAKAGRSVPVPGAVQEDIDSGWQNLQVVNGKPYADMYFKHYGVNPTIDTEEEALSTFSIDVDTASYSVARSYLNRNNMPEEDSIRVEEFVNKFDYAYATPETGAFSVQVEAFPSPNRKGYHVLHIGLKGKEVTAEQRKPANLVFVIDVSGSMNMENRLTLAKQALALLVGQLRSDDSVGIVVYGSSAHTVLEPTFATQESKDTIMRAIDALTPEGSTNAQAGLELGYQMAARNFRESGINRIILCSDGVANNGITNADKIFERVKDKADAGITISTVGLGMGNYNDVLMERLADKGNGNYAYVDDLKEARRIFVEELTGTLQVIAKDVKIQLAFDEDAVSRYRLLGFENRILEKEEFENDAVDAGEIGAGHTVTAMYEVKFRNGVRPKGDFAELRIRYKKPEGHRSQLIERGLPFGVVRDSYEQASPPTKLSLVAAAFAEKLRGSYWVRNLSYNDILGLWAQIPRPLRDREDVQELHGLIETARRLDNRGDKFADVAPVAQMDFDKVPVLQ